METQKEIFWKRVKQNNEGPSRLVMCLCPTSTLTEEEVMSQFVEHENAIGKYDGRQNSSF